MATAKKPTTDDLAAQVDQLKSDIGDLTSLLAEYGKVQKDNAADAVKAKAAEARKRGEHLAEAAGAQVAHFGAEAEAMVQRQPATALGIAAGIGFLIGMLGARR